MSHYIYLLSKVYASLGNFYSGMQMSTAITSHWFLCFYNLSVKVLFFFQIMKYSATSDQIRNMAIGVQGWRKIEKDQ